MNNSYIYISRPAFLRLFMAFGGYPSPEASLFFHLANISPSRGPLRLVCQLCIVKMLADLSFVGKLLVNNC